MIVKRRVQRSSRDHRSASWTCDGHSTYHRTDIPKSVYYFTLPPLSKCEVLRASIPASDFFFQFLSELPELQFNLLKDRWKFTRLGGSNRDVGRKRHKTAWTLLDEPFFLKTTMGT
ncbi:hypothetical protein C2G38_2159660 [Gigaspora rosea]|uniref:Uncharacterized protein n=1 Tax=Gigaspora rosea TaxID=44941 RepID=A0A397W2I6_9GLOM|nr:hypothetical protein C2G38_2159660 [Gigaspora rosea]